MTPNGLYFAEAQEEREAIESFRFHRLVVERKYHLPTADYQSKRLPLEGDEGARLIYMSQEQQVRATARLCRFQQGPYLPLQLELFDPAALASFAALSETAILDNLLLPKADKATREDFTTRIIRFALQSLGQMQNKLLFVCCQERERNFYMSIGFLPYKEGQLSLTTGLLIPMYLFLPDIKHLLKLESPLLGSYAPISSSPPANHCSDCDTRSSEVSAPCPCKR